MISSFIVIEILDFAGEYIKCAFLAFPPRVRKHVMEKLKLELYKWQLFLTRKPRLHNKTLYSNVPEIAKLGVDYFYIHDIFAEKGLDICTVEIAKILTKVHDLYPDYCLQSSNMEVVQFGLDNGAENYSYCLQSSNIEVVKFGLSKLSPLNKVLIYKNNNMSLEVVKLFERIHDVNLMLISNHLDVVEYAISLGAKDFKYCLKSDNLEVVQLGLQKGVKNYKDLCKSSNLEIIKLALKKGMTKKYILKFNNHIDVLLYLTN